MFVCEEPKALSEAVAVSSASATELKGVVSEVEEPAFP
jgi:hypothetical protein